MQTERLIDRLAENGEVVRPLPGPWTRAAVWLAVAAPYVALVVVVVSPRPDLILKIAEPRFVLEQGAALATAITAAIAAFATIIPGYGRRLVLLPLLPLVVWLGTLGLGCVQTWLKQGLEGLSLRPDWICFPAIVLVGALPAIAMTVMLRRGAPLTPRLTAALGGLAAAGLGNFGLRLFHPQDASLMILVWQVGTVMILTLLAGWAGRYFLNWSSIVEMTRRKALVR